MNCCLQKLTCQNCFLKDTDLAVLAEVPSLRSNRSLKHLSLSGNIHVTGESLLKFLDVPSNLQYLDLSSCGICSPIPEGLTNRQVGFSRHLKYLNLSHNSFNEQDMQTLLRLWRLTWRENSSVIITKSITILSSQAFNE